MLEGKHRRADRVAPLLQQELAQLLVAGLKDPRVGFVTVTTVRVTDDLRNAWVYVSAIGTEAQVHASLEGLQAASGFLRRALGVRLQLRVVPTLHFLHDDTIARAARLQTLLTAAAHGDHEPPAASSAAALPEASTARSGRSAAASAEPQ